MSLWVRLAVTRRTPVNWAVFSNLKWSVVILEPYFDPLPTEIHTVEGPGVDIVQPGAGLSRENTMLATQAILSDLPGSSGMPFSTKGCPEGK